MKKSILALFVLLLIFILTCVYQKTYQIYAKTNDNTATTESATLPSQPSEPAAILPNTKKEDTVLKVETTKVIAIKSTPKEPEITALKKVIETATATKTIKAVPVETSTKKPEEVKKKEITLTKPTIEKESKTVTKKEPAKKTVPIASITVKEDHDLKEIDSLMQALKDRDIALKNREELELHIQQLIKKALDDRFKAIAYMNKEELRLLELQKELLNVRDIAYKKIGQTNTPTSGE